MSKLFEVITRNQAGVIKNVYQGDEKRVLCVCSAGVLRSPTAAYVLAEKYGYNTRAAGLRDYALIPVTPHLLYWADEIVCMEHAQRFELKAKLDELELKRDVVVLDVPDEYERMNPELVDLILRRYAEATQG